MKAYMESLLNTIKSLNRLHTKNTNINNYKAIKPNYISFKSLKLADNSHPLSSEPATINI